MRWEAVLVREGGGEGGHHFMVELSHVWHQIP
jgi:hypothetical protein